MGSDMTRKVTADAHDVTQIVSQLAAQHLIRPTTTQGHIGDVLKDKIVFDAATTSGGSGGPLFNRDGKVIGPASGFFFPPGQLPFQNVFGTLKRDSGVEERQQ
jgi:S1-C subfamily serine protease